MKLLRLSWPLDARANRSALASGAYRRLWLGEDARCALARPTIRLRDPALLRASGGT